jgi:hypothetical protein
LYVLAICGGVEPASRRRLRLESGSKMAFGEGFCCCSYWLAEGRGLFGISVSADASDQSLANQSWVT